MPSGGDAPGPGSSGEGSGAGAGPGAAEATAMVTTAGGEEDNGCDDAGGQSRQQVGASAAAALVGAAIPMETEPAVLAQAVAAGGGQGPGGLPVPPAQQRAQQGLPAAAVGVQKDPARLHSCRPEEAAELARQGVAVPPPKRTRSQ